jgi:serine/threonine protein kinase
MEYCGSNLYDTVTKSKFTTEEIKPNVYKWLINTAKGLQCMHNSKYAHLDIKPDNIVIDEQQESKLIDFGLIFDFTKNTDINTNGTLDYMPFERLDNNATDAEKCDVYSLGITFIECAFALHYPNRYKHIYQGTNLPTVLNTFYGILRAEHVVLQSTPPTLTLLIIDNDHFELSGWKIYKINKNFLHEYTLRDLYMDIMTIHTNYPILTLTAVHLFWYLY